MEQEGVVKYQLDFESGELSLDPFELSELNACRQRLKQAGMVGQNPLRYDGIGFGNISYRNPKQTDQFVITGTQTGAIDVLLADHLACVTAVDATDNYLRAFGITPPSSEAMTHGVLYQLDQGIEAVVHVHSPDIWYHCDALQLASTSADIDYGTPAMAAAVSVVCQSLGTVRRPLVFVMKGHQDGVVAAGDSLENCADVLLALQAKASG